MSALPALEDLREHLKYLSPEERAELLRLVEEDIRLKPWRPLPGPQRQALESPADILYFGGQAGGGKSYLLLGAAGWFHRRSLIVRREFTQMQDLWDKSKALYTGHGFKNEGKWFWRLQTGGHKRLVEFGSMPHAGDEEDFAGRPHDLIAVDEVPHLTEHQFRFIQTWLRTEIEGQRTRVIAAGNPPTDQEGEWVIRFWGPWLDDNHPKPAKPGELRYYTTIDGEDHECPGPEPVLHKGEKLVPLSRTFIPASVHSNPFHAGTKYIAALQALPEPLRSKMLYGDFRAGRKDHERQVFPTEWIKAAQERWKKIDPATIGPMDRLGVDVARGGKAKTVIAPWHGRYCAQLQRHPGKDTVNGPEVAALVVLSIKDDAIVQIDIGGVDSSPYDSLEATEGVHAIPMNGAAKSEAYDRSRRLRMVNKRAEWAWKLREALDPKLGDEIALPPDPELLADLTAIRWELTPRGVKIEDKDEIIERLGRSPDAGEACIYGSAMEGVGARVRTL